MESNYACPRVTFVVSKQTLRFLALKKFSLRCFVGDQKSGEERLGLEFFLVWPQPFLVLLPGVADALGH